MEFDARASLELLLETWRFTRKSPSKDEIKDAKTWRADFEKWYMTHVFDQEYADQILADAKEAMDVLGDHKRPPILIKLARMAIPQAKSVELSKEAVLVPKEVVKTIPFKDLVQIQFEKVWERWPHRHGRYPISEGSCGSAFRSLCKNQGLLDQVALAADYYLSLVEKGDDHGYGLLGFLSSTMTETGLPVWEVYHHRAKYVPKGRIADTFDIVWEQYPPFKNKSDAQKERERFEFSSHVKCADDCLQVIAAVRAYCAERHETSTDEKTLQQYTISFHNFLPNWRQQEGLEDELGKMLAEQFVSTFPLLVTGLYDPAPYLAMCLKQGKTPATSVREIADFFLSMTGLEYDASQIKPMLARTLSQALTGTKTYQIG